MREEKYFLCSLRKNGNSNENLLVKFFLDDKIQLIAIFFSCSLHAYKITRSIKLKFSLAHDFLVGKDEKKILWLSRSKESELSEMNFSRYCDDKL